jgi:hypothetical protein
MNLTNGSLHSMIYTQVEKVPGAYPKLKVVKISRSMRGNAKLLEKMGIRVRIKKKVVKPKD